MKLFDELKYRGLVDNISSPELEEKINNGGMTFYFGTDPSSDSLHIGHFSSLLVCKRLKDHGHHPILLVGGATGLIGDPKPNSERPMITKAELDKNYNALQKQIKDLLDFDMVNNYDWSKDINFIDYLRDYGKYFPITYMLNKDTVKRRMDVGITYTEFSYMILQALDFLYLYENKGCTMQIGGQDQWGNITAGIELIRKKVGGEAFALTMPLITKADGTKFGKSESGTVWISKEKTSPYEMYQFFLNTEDEKVIEYIKKLTMLEVSKIQELEKIVESEPHLREGQKQLAKEVITFLHGNEEYEKAVRMSEVLFNGDVSSLNEDEIETVIKNHEVADVTENLEITDFLLLVGAAKSKREAREFIAAGAVSINGLKINDEFKIIKESALFNKYFIVRKGKKNYFFAVIK